ncbi:Two component regulator propeller [Ostertagia ostertagi]
MAKPYKTTLADVDAGKTCQVFAVKDTSATFLQYLQKLGIDIGTSIRLVEKIAFDDSIVIAIEKLCITNACAQTAPMIHYTMEDGLPSNNVYNVYRDTKGYLWFGTDKGVARYNGISFQTYTMADGLPDNEVYMIKEDKQQRLWMILSNGKLCYYRNGRCKRRQRATILPGYAGEEI